jgi:hypothetical protein
MGIDTASWFCGNRYAGKQMRRETLLRTYRAGIAAGCAVLARAEGQGDVPRWMLVECEGCGRNEPTASETLTSVVIRCVLLTE